MSNIKKGTVYFEVLVEHEITGIKGRILDKYRSDGIDFYLIVDESGKCWKRRPKEIETFTPDQPKQKNEI